MRNCVPFQAPHHSPAQHFFRRRTGKMTERIRIMMLDEHSTSVRSFLTLNSPTSAVQIMIFLLMRNRIAMMITDNALYVRKFFPIYSIMLICHLRRRLKTFPISFPKITRKVCAFAYFSEDVSRTTLEILISYHDSGSHFFHERRRDYWGFLRFLLNKKIFPATLCISDKLKTGTTSKTLP